MTPEPRRADALDVRFDPQTELVPAIVQSAVDGSVRMLGYMDADALERTLRTGRVTFFSRSRGRLWEKGESSGHHLDVVEVRTDCDGDALLVRAVPRGPTCHTGRERCFDAGAAVRPRAGEADPGAASPARADPERAGPERAAPEPEEAGRGLPDAIAALLSVIAARDRDRPPGSYTVRLLEAGAVGAARKVGEEALEVVLAAAADPVRLAEESADLLYHLLVLWRAAGLEPGEVGEVLRRRRAGDPDGTA